jgi:4-amino-4-deoxy-L-arabinose transferase-like glycosyltransferase
LIWLFILHQLLAISDQTLIFPDASNYNEAATNLYWYYRGHCYRPMLMAIIYGFPLLFGASDTDLYTIAIFINIVLWLATILILFEMFKNYVSQRIAFGFTLVFVLMITNALYNFHLLAEIPFLFFLLLSFYFIQKYNNTKVFKWLAIGLALLVLSMLVKPASKFFAILLLIYFIKVLFKNYKKRSMLFLYASLLLCFIQAAGLKHQFGDFTISYIDSVTFHNYIFSKADAYRNGEEYHQTDNERAAYLFTHKVHEQKQIANADIKEQLLNNKVNLLKAYGNNLFWNSVTGSICINAYSNTLQSKNYEKKQAVLYTISKYQNRLMTVLGIIIGLFSLLFYYKKESTAFLAALFIVYIIGISGISSDQGDRFHLITYPFTLMLIAVLIKTKPFAAPLQK